MHPELLYPASPSVRISKVGARRAQQTDASGRHRLEKLDPGPYEIEVSRSGFRIAVQRVTLRVGDDALLNFPLQVGQLNEQVEVVSTATALNRTGLKIGWVRRPHKDFRASAERAEFPGAGPAVARRHRGSGDEPRRLWQQLPAGAHERRLLLARRRTRPWMD